MLLAPIHMNLNRLGKHFPIESSIESFKYRRFRSTRGLKDVRPGSLLHSPSSDTPFSCPWLISPPFSSFGPGHHRTGSTRFRPTTTPSEPSFPL